jgi:glycogen(starch) synthase
VSQLRAVFVSREHPAGESVGGIGTYTATMARALARRGVDVTVVTRGEPAEWVDADGVTIVRLNHPRLGSGSAARLVAAVRTARVVRALNPDIVQAAEWEAEAWAVARLLRRPLVTRLATPTYLLERLNWGATRPESALVRRLERDQARRSAALVAPSLTIAERVTADWSLESEVEVIPNPLDLEEVRNAGENDPPVSLPARFLLMIGGAERRKGVHVLAAALPSILARHPDLHAVLVGRQRGTEADRALENLWRQVDEVRDRVHVLGLLAREDALAVMARAEIVVLPSLWEAFGFVAVEALALGRPIVAAGGSGFAEILDDGVSGILVPPGDAHALEEAVLGVLGDPEAAGRLAEGGRRRSEDFDSAATAATLHALYDRCVGEAQPERFDETIYTRGYRRYFRADDQRDPFHDLYEAKREAVLADLLPRDPARVLDAGGGPGRLAAPLAARHEVTLCDLSADMLEEARRACPPGVRFVQADARALPFDGGAFDVVLALDLIVHLPTIESGLSELVRVLAPGGRLVFDTTNAAPWWVLGFPAYVNWRPKRLVRTLLGDGVLPEWRQIVKHQHAPDVRRAIAAAGLELEGCRPFGPPWSAKWHLWTATKPA